MNNIFNSDFQEFIEELNKYDVAYILVGGYSVIIHGYNRTTGDLDVWVKPVKPNFDKLIAACSGFGLSTDDLTEENFLANDELDVFTFGRPPVSIDIMTKVKGLDFDETYALSQIAEIDGVKIRVIHKNHLIQAKEAAGRSKDHDDIEHLKDE
jgi:predicted nucleotidyltransferase